VTSITRTKMIFHSMNVFVDFVKLILRVKHGKRERRNYFLSK
jgi:hypothetical protein